MLLKIKYFLYVMIEVSYCQRLCLCLQLLLRVVGPEVELLFLHFQRSQLTRFRHLFHTSWSPPGEDGVPSGGGLGVDQDMLESLTLHWPQCLTRKAGGGSWRIGGLSISSLLVYHMTQTGISSRKWMDGLNKHRITCVVTFDIQRRCFLFLATHKLVEFWEFQQFFFTVFTFSFWSLLTWH